MASYRVDGQAQDRYEGNIYSVPCEYAHRRIELRAFYNRILFYADDKIIRECPRSYAGGSDNYDYHHYIKLLRRAPGACLNGKPYLGMPAILLQYRDRLKDTFNRREAGLHLARVLDAVTEAGDDRVCEAVELAVASGTLDGEAVITVLETLRRAGVSRCQPLNVDSRSELSTFQVTPANPQQYDQLQEVCA